MTELSDATAAVTALVTQYGVTRDQMADLLSGPADGGPNGDGQYPVTLADGSATIMVPSPRKIALLPSGVQLWVASRAALAAITGPTAGTQAYLGEAGREGLFTWITGNQNARVTADPNQSLYVAPSGQPNGSAGAWRRVLMGGFALASWAGVTAGASIDQAPAINRLLAMASVSAVLLPVGIVTINSPILIPSGKSVLGQGEGLTTVKALATFQTLNNTYPNANSLLYGMSGAVGVRVADMTLDGSKIGTHYLNGVNFYANRGFVAESLIVKDISGYGCWAVADTGPSGYKPDGCSGIFRDIWAYNCNVYFETTAANNVLFERCHARDGDGDVPAEAGIHPNSGSRNITYRDCSIVSTQLSCGALIANYVAYPLDSITLDNCLIHLSNGAAAMAIATFSTSPTTNVRVLNCSITSDGYIGCYTSGAVEVRIEGGSIDGLQEGLTVNAGATALVRGTRLTARSAGADANNYPLLVESSSPGNTSVTLDGPILDSNGAALASYPTTSVIRVLAAPVIVDNTPVVPMGVGHKVTRALPADQPIAGSSGATVIGAGVNTWTFNGLSQGTYRVRAEGSYRAADTVTAFAFNNQSTGACRVSGRAQAEAAANDAAPVSATMATNGEGLIAALPDAENASRGFRADVILVATDPSGPNLGFVAGSFVPGTGYGGGGITIEAGAVLTIEKLA